MHVLNKFLIQKYLRGNCVKVVLKKKKSIIIFCQEVMLQQRETPNLSSLTLRPHWGLWCATSHTHIVPECQPAQSWTSPLPLPSPSRADSSRPSVGGCGCWRTGSWSRSCWHFCGWPRLVPARSGEHAPLLQTCRRLTKKRKCEASEEFPQNDWKWRIKYWQKIKGTVLKKL